MQFLITLSSIWVSFKVQKREPDDTNNGVVPVRELDHLKRVAYLSLLSLPPSLSGAMQRPCTKDMYSLKQSVTISTLVVGCIICLKRAVLVFFNSLRTKEFLNFFNSLRTKEFLISSQIGDLFHSDFCQLSFQNP